MTGDVLPCFDASSLSLPENGALVVTVPTSLSIASKHGVILSSQVFLFLFQFRTLSQCKIGVSFVLTEERSA